MRSAWLVGLLWACTAGGEKDVDDTDAETDVSVDTDVADPCAACDENATCDTSGAAPVCVCDAGYEGDGQDCDDIDECATDNGGCDVNADCTNEPGGRSCECTYLYEGDGLTCTAWVDLARSGCAIPEAEHPSYTTIARDVALCGGSYPVDNLASACNVGWSVCTVSEWTARYPIRTYRDDPTAPDLIGPTIGLVTSWGTDQTARCPGGVWQADQPTDPRVWTGSVCHDPDAALGSYLGGSYNPWNNRKAMLGDDGVTPHAGVNAVGEISCCDWDVGAVPATDESDAAVYCCREL
jgi:hypothetical protein